MDELLRSRLEAGLSGLSSHAMRMHLALYDAYGEELDRLAGSLDAAPSSAEWVAIAKRGAYVRNAVLLHDLFFQSLVQGGAPAPPDLEARATERFGSFDVMLGRLAAAASSGNGWGLLIESADAGGFLDVAALEEHHVGSLVGVRVLFALDGWEHSYWYDYGPSKETYLRTVLGNVDWLTVAARSQSPRAELLTAAPVPIDSAAELRRVIGSSTLLKGP